MMGRRAIIAGFLLTFTKAAAAQTSWSDGVVIEWQAPPACPDAPRVRASIDALLRGPIAGRDRASSILFEARVTQPGPGFRLELRTQAGAASEIKILEAETCNVLADAFAIVVAYAVDPAAPPPPPESAPLPRASLLPERVPSGKVVRFGAGPVVATGAGILPLPAFGVGAAIALGDAPRWEIAGWIWPAKKAELEANAGPGGAEVGLLAGRASMCWSFISSGSLAACGGIELGRMRGTGILVSTPARGDSWWAAATAGLSTHVAVGPYVDLRLRLDVGVPFFRPRFLIQDGDLVRAAEAWRPAPVFGMLTFEPEIAFSSTDRGGTGHP